MLVAAAVLPARIVGAQGIARDSAQQSWTLRSGPVVYRLITRNGRVALDYFGPASKEGPQTRVAPSYTRIATVEFA